MECYYHPGEESEWNCAICNKSVCKECGLEIAGKVYCKDCLEKIIGLNIENKTEDSKENAIVTEPQEVNAQTDDLIYQPADEKEDFEIPYSHQEEVSSIEYEGINDNSPYNIKNIDTSSLESSYLNDMDQPIVAQDELNKLPEQELYQKMENDNDFIYPDHSYEPQKTSARLELEDKYEKYLEDLYFDENEVPLGEQLAKDEAQYGSLTRKEYAPREKMPHDEITSIPKGLESETPEEMEARIRAELLKEQELMTSDDSSNKSPLNLKGRKPKKENRNIHNINYKDEKEQMGIVDIILTIILVIVILIVVYYIIYLFLLNSSYPTFMDAIFALRNPQNVINALLTPK